MIPQLPVPFVSPIPGSEPMEIVWGTAALWGVLGLLLLATFAILADVLRAKIHQLEAPRFVRCPMKNVPARIELEPVAALLNSIFGVPKPQVRACSMWPALMPCDGACLGETGA